MTYIRFDTCFDLDIYAYYHYSQKYCMYVPILKIFRIMLLEMLN